MPRLVVSRLPNPHDIAGAELAVPGNGLGNGAIADYLERVAKYIPVEIVSALLAIRSVVPAQGAPDALPVKLEIGLYALPVVLTPLYLLRLGGDVPQKTRQLAIAMVSFMVWSYAIGGPFFWSSLEELSNQQIIYPGLAGALVVIWSLAAGLFQPAAR